MTEFYSTPVGSGQNLYIKVIGIDGTVVAAPLDVAKTEFTEIAYVVGQPKMGEFTLTLRPTWDAKYRRGMYNALLPEQRIEFYENPELLGDPKFTGVLRRRAKGLARERLIKGDDITHRLDARRLRAYHRLTGNAKTVIESLLNTYDLYFGDDFNRITGLGANWTLAVGTWAIVSNAAKVTSASGSMYSPSFTQPQWASTKISFDMLIPTPSGSPTTYSIYILRDAGTFQNDYQIQFTDASASGWTNPKQIALWEDVAGSSSQIAYREFNFLSDVLNHIDIYYDRVGSVNTIIVVLNDVEIFNLSQTTPTINTSGVVYFSADQNSQLDNFMFSPLTAALTPGNIDATTETIDQVFNGDSQLKAIQWICDKLGWTYRVRPKAGAGNDLFDCGATVGHNWTNDGLVLEEGKNLETLDIDESFDNIATVLHTYGQNRDDATSSFISTAVSAMATYGTVEQEYADERIVSSDIAKAIGDARLDILAAGSVSLQGRIKDESHLYQQIPRWEYALWEDSIWEGREKIRIGDLVPILSDDLNIDKTATIVSITRNSEELNRPSLVFDYHGWASSMLIKRLNGMISVLQRANFERMNSQNVHYVFAGSGGITWTINLFGKAIGSADISILSAVWGGVTVSLLVNGAPLPVATANAVIHDTTLFIAGGIYTVSIQVNGAIELDVSIKTNVTG